jgi:hypothetical protein
MLALIVFRALDVGILALLSHRFDERNAGRDWKREREATAIPGNYTDIFG